jgi:hypothetical protein
VSEESVPAFGLADLEEDERPETIGLPIAVVRCERCGGDRVIVAIAGERSPWCGGCRPAMVGFPHPDRDLYPVLSGPHAPLPQGPWGVTYGPEPRPKTLTGTASYPRPEWTSRDDVSAPDVPTVQALADRARAAGWVVDVASSRGSVPHGSTGRPTAVKTLWSVRMRHPDGVAAYAVRAGAAWSSVMIWGKSITWFPYASITDLGEFVDAAGDVPPDWFDAIRRRVLAADAKRKAAPKKAVAGRREGLS